MEKNFLTPDWKNYLPEPIFAEKPEYNGFYLKAWELAHDHVRSIDGMPQNPYMDEAFCDTQIWIWDSCFMAQFCKLAQSVFPGVETLSNFYETLYGTKKLPQILTSKNEPSWTGAKPGEMNPIVVHIADNPPLFAWSEYENAIISGDKEHLRKLLCEQKYLQKHYEWFEGLSERTKIDGVLCETCLIAEELGYRWEGGRSGMDNTPRGRDVPNNGKERPNNPDLLWIDAICQQALSARTIAEMLELLGDAESAKEWRDKFEAKKAIVNEYYWDEESGFYYDYDIKKGELNKVMTIASYWTMTAGIAPRERAEKMLEQLFNPETLGGKVPLISLARSDGDYHSNGRYWRGGLWLPTAYAALKGLSSYGYDKEAHELASAVISHMLATYEEYEPHTIWECYSPELHEPARQVNGKVVVRPDFCGWSALGPIAMYVEYVIGFKRIDAFRNEIEWAKPTTDKEIGIKNLAFGDTVTDIVASGNEVTVKSNKPYKLKINGKSYEIHQGETKLKI